MMWKITKTTYQQQAALIHLSRIDIVITFTSKNLLTLSELLIACTVYWPWQPRPRLLPRESLTLCRLPLPQTLIFFRLKLAQSVRSSSSQRHQAGRDTNMAVGVLAASAVCTTLREQNRY